MAESKEADVAGDHQEQQQQQNQTQALALKWAFGFNKNCHGGVHNLSDDNRNAVFYFAAHTGVIYDYVSRKQMLLQGHCNPITCCAVSSDKRWIVTADEGPDSMIVVWDSLTGTPIKTLFNVHHNGAISIDMSPDAMFLVTLSNLVDGEQEVAVWEWTVDHDGPLYAERCPVSASSLKQESKYDENEEASLLQTNIRFNCGDIREFVTTGPETVVFWSWHSKKLEHQRAPELSKVDFGARIGDFTRTVYLPNSNRAVSGTTEGNLVLWDSMTLGDEGGEVCMQESKTNLQSDMITRAAMKVVKLNRTGSIPYLTTHDDLIVICGEDESIRFYDLEFRIVAWFEDLEAGAVISVSFSNSSGRHYVDTPINEKSKAANPRSKKGPVKYGLSDFVLSTSRALIVGVDAATFDDACPENRRGTLLLQGFDGPIACICTHPSHNTLLAVSATGILQAWDFEDRRLILTRTMHPDDKPTCADFSKDGQFIAIGFENGMVRILRWANSRDMGEICCFQVYQGTAARIIKFSQGSTFLGVADDDHCVGLYRFVPSDVSTVDGIPFSGADSMKVNQGKRRSEPGPGLEPGDGSDSRNGWTYLGRHHTHSAKVTSLDFGKTEHEEDRFISVGADGALVEYDLQQSSVVDGIKLVSPPKRIEFGSCVPTSCLFQPATKGSREDLIITTNTEYKLKYFNASNHSCRKTTLGPTYGGPLTGLAMLEEGGGLQYLAYSTSEKVIGLVKLPLDGNPHKSLGLIAHPGEISGFVASHDDKYLLTAGGSDMTINVWSVNTSALDTASVNASSAREEISGIPKSLIPYLPLIDGGGHGDLYEEIVDYFYYSQLRCQGEETTAPRQTDGFVPLTEIPNLMRALGFYPTEHEIENMCSEVRYSAFSTTARTVDSINMEQFIKLYINHRPVIGLSQEQIAEAFEKVQDHCSGSVDWNGMRKLLQEVGEAMPIGELESCLTMLMGRKEASSLRATTHISPGFFSKEMLGLRTAVEKIEDEGRKVNKK